MGLLFGVLGSYLKWYEPQFFVGCGNMSKGDVLLSIFKRHPNGLRSLDILRILR